MGPDFHDHRIPSSLSDRQLQLLARMDEELEADRALRKAAHLHARPSIGHRLRVSGWGAFILGVLGLATMLAGLATSLLLAAAGSVAVAVAIVWSIHAAREAKIATRLRCRLIRLRDRLAEDDESGRAERPEH